MHRICAAQAFANNEVAFLAWETDPPEIPGCLGFHIVREYLDDHDQPVETLERPLASYVAFKGQRNPDWREQNTSVWPIQKFTWRDLTLRKKRDELGRRPANERVRYRIQAVGRWEHSLDPVEVIPSRYWDKSKKEWATSAYEGEPIPLGFLTPPAFTNPIDVTCNRPPFVSAFTNGVLSTQFLRNVLMEDGKIESGELEGRLRTPGDSLRRYLAGDVITVIKDFFDRKSGRLKAALYELEDDELVELLADNADRLDLILSDAGSPGTKKPPVYDSRNAEAREKLRALAQAQNATFTMQDRMFNGSGHIGHNKFIVHVDDQGVAQAVLTGSTNWTWSGLSAQSNNCTCINEPEIAEAFSSYWDRLHQDALPRPRPKLSSPSRAANQSDAFKTSNRDLRFETGIAGGGRIEAWFSPNVPGAKQPPSKPSRAVAPPPDMDRLFSLMRKAERAIFFLVFLPSRGGVRSIVEKAIDMGAQDTSLIVLGAISDPQAMVGFIPASKDEDGQKIASTSPRVFQNGNVSVVRATALVDEAIEREIGDFKLDEKLKTGVAIIHDKVLVIDPHDPQKCVVAFGSHNMGYKASYSNDENLVIVRGCQPLAQAYAAHCLDIYDHYRFRAVETELSENKSDEARWDGFLDPTDAWQAKSSRTLSRYFTDTGHPS